MLFNSLDIHFIHYILHITRLCINVFSQQVYVYYRWYQMALQVYPRNGRPFNQLAVIAFSQVRLLAGTHYLSSFFFLLIIIECIGTEHFT